MFGEKNKCVHTDKAPLQYLPEAEISVVSFLASPDSQPNPRHAQQLDPVPAVPLESPLLRLQQLCFLFLTNTTDVFFLHYYLCIFPWILTGELQEIAPAR